MVIAEDRAIDGTETNEMIIMNYRYGDIGVSSDSWKFRWQSDIRLDYYKNRKNIDIIENQ